MSESRSVGRPLAYASAEMLQSDVDLYFASTNRPTLAGLAVHLGINRQTLYNYEDKDEFLDIVKKARAKVEAIYEERLVWDNVTGVIFPLKNMGWKDKTETDMNVNGGVQVIMKNANQHETK